MRVDVHQHLGIWGVSGEDRKDLFDVIFLNPAYKYSCQCCVDGFYQQLAWNKDKGYPQLGIYNPKCRVPIEVELGRQLDKGIVGIVLNPINHGYDIFEASKVFQFAEDQGLPVYIYAGKISDLEKLSWVLDEFRITIVMIRGSQTADWVSELVNHPRAFAETSLFSPVKLGEVPRDKLVFGSHYPYSPIPDLPPEDILNRGSVFLK